MTTTEIPLCAYCRHFDHIRWVCSAFKTGIPIEIVTGEHDHHKPFNGDHGIQFEPIEQEKGKRVDNP